MIPISIGPCTQARRQNERAFLAELLPDTVGIRTRGGESMRFFRLVWVAVAALTVGVFVWGLPSEFARLQAPCDDATSCAWLPRLTGENARQLEEVGLSTNFFAAYFIAIEVVFSAMSFAIGSLIFWRRPEGRMALVVSLTLITFGATFFVPFPLLDLPLLWKLSAETISFVGSALLILFLYLFPDGRFVPRWTRFLVAVCVATLVPISFSYDSVIFVFGNPMLNAMLATGFVGVTVFAQVYRYRRVSNPAQRRQTRWVIFGIVTALGGACALAVLNFVFPGGVASSLLGSTALFCFAFLIPLSIGVAVLRSRLFDIDVLINRTLVYGCLTVTLVAAYVGSVVSLQYVFRTLTGGGSQLAIVASTLVIAALFNTLRHRIQSFIDRRFYRRKYDAARTLSAFATRLRDETDLEQLNGELLSVVRTTMQPEHATLWLNEREIET
jgi:hypothetical protein